MVRVGINGLGVMGRYLIRAIEENALDLDREEENKIEIVAFNDICPADQIAPLLAHDSIYLGFPGTIELSGNDIKVNGKTIKGFQEKDPANIKWSDLGVDIVYESTGVFVNKPGVDGHLKAGAKKVIFSAPSDFAQKTIVMGVNHGDYKNEAVISAGSCTTNCLAPLASAIFNEYGDFTGHIITIHAYTQDQNLQDAPHKDPARAYNATENIVPTSTGAAKAIGKVIPSLEGKLDGIAARVPVATGSLVYLVASLDREVTTKQINETIKGAASTYLKGTLEYREGPVVSSMTIGTEIPSIFDAKQTHTIGNQIQVVSHYDNVSAFSHQAAKLINLVGKNLS